jgi:hypothetical protein
MPLLRPPQCRASKTGDFLRREDYYTRNEVATKKREKPAFLLGEIESESNNHLLHTPF